jgi:hypothetical protein
MIAVSRAPFDTRWSGSCTLWRLRKNKVLSFTG